MITSAAVRNPRNPAAWLAAAFAALLCSAAPALAQPPSRAFIIVNAGVQALTSGFSQSAVFTDSTIYGPLVSEAAAHEQSSFESAYGFDPGGTLADASIGVHVWSYLGIGLGVSQFDIEEPASVSAQLPQPLFFDRSRSISGMSAPLSRRERAVHLHLLMTIPATRSFSIMLFGGPTYFDTEQDLVADVQFDQSYPFDTATFSSAVASDESGQTIGYHAGVDIAWYFTDSIGVGLLTRFSRGTLKLPSVGGGAVDIETGGVQAAAGLRLRF